MTAHVDNAALTMEPFELSCMLNFHGEQLLPEMADILCLLLHLFVSVWNQSGRK